MNKRLTEKRRGIYELPRTKTQVTCNILPSTLIEATQKLGQLEDLENEFGIDLVTLFKALKNGINSNLGFNPPDYLSIHKGYIYSDYEPCEYHFKDYGKTWALTRKELDNNGNL